MRYGADGYLLKDLTPETLFQHLRGLAGGDTPLARGMAGKLFRQVAQMGQPPARPAAVSALSEREGEVLAVAGDRGVLREGDAGERVAAELHDAALLDHPEVLAAHLDRLRGLHEIRDGPPRGGRRARQAGGAIPG